MYGKIFASLFTGSMRGKGDLQLVFMYMLANASRDGVCDFMPQCIADATGKTIEVVQDSLRQLESPDNMSRTKTEDGRRIKRIDDERPWGWVIVNYEMYRQIADRDAMRAIERDRKRKQRMSSMCPGQSQKVHELTASASASASSSLEEEGGMQGGKEHLLPEPKPKRKTWLTPFADLWELKLGGKMPFGQAASELKSLVEQHGSETVLQYLERYLDGTEARYVSLSRFSQTFGAWDGKHRSGPGAGAGVGHARVPSPPGKYDEIEARARTAFRSPKTDQIGPTQQS